MRVLREALSTTTMPASPSTPTPSLETLTLSKYLDSSEGLDRVDSVLQDVLTTCAKFPSLPDIDDAGALVEFLARIKEKVRLHRRFYRLSLIFCLLILGV